MRFRASNLPLLVSVVVAMAAAVWFAGDAQQPADRVATNRAAANDGVVNSLLDQDRDLTAYVATSRPSLLRDYQAAGRAFERSIADAHRVLSGNSGDAAMLSDKIGALYAAKRSGRNRVETAAADVQISTAPGANGAPIPDEGADEALTQ